MPLIKLTDFFLNRLFAPVTVFSPVLQITIIAGLAVIISLILENKFSNAKTDALEADLNEKIKSLKYTRDIKDPQTKHVIRKGINNSADLIYEELLINKFFNLGMSYFFPMMFFLIWIEYSFMTQEKLILLTGKAPVIQLYSGIPISTAFYYIGCFNFGLISYKILKYILLHMNGIVFQPDL
jgi:hypothetical protein